MPTGSSWGRTMTRAMLLTLIMCPFWLACSGGGAPQQDSVDSQDIPSADTSTVPTLSSYAQDQRTLEGGDFDAVLAESSELSALRDQLVSDGFDVFLRGSRLTLDDARVVNAGVYANASSDTTRTLLQACWDEACTASIAKTVDGTYEIVSGPDLPDSDWPVPVLVKELVVGESGSLFNLDNPTQTLPASLQVDEVIEGWDLDKRSMKIVTSFGEIFDHSSVEALLGADWAARFQDKSFTTMMQRQDLEQAFGTADPLDLLVIYAPTILQVGSTGPEGKTYKSVGVSVALDPIVDETFDYKDFRDLIGRSAFYGPGTLVLFGCDSLLNFDPQTKESLMQELSRSYSNETDLNVNRLLIGWSGCANTDAMAASLDTLMGHIYDGQPLSVAVEQTNEALASMGGDAQIMAVLGTQINPDVVLPEIAQAGWDGASPQGGELIGRLQTIPQCDDGSGTFVLGTETDILVRAKPFSWNGTAFSGTWDQTDAQGTVVGVLNDPSVGESFYYVYVGSPEAAMQDLVLFAEAKIESIEKSSAQWEIEFSGKARFSMFSNEQGQSCTLNQVPNLTTATADLSRLLIDFAP